MKYSIKNIEAELAKFNTTGEKIEYLKDCLFERNNKLASFISFEEPKLKLLQDKTAQDFFLYHASIIKDKKKFPFWYLEGSRYESVNQKTANRIGITDHKLLIERLRLEKKLQEIQGQITLFESLIEKVKSNLPLSDQTESKIVLQKPKSDKELLFLSSFFDSISRYHAIMEILASRGFIEKNTGIWKDEANGNKGFLAAIIKDLHGKGYYKNKSRPTNNQIEEICQSTFGWRVGIETVKRAKPDNFDLTFIPPASTLL